MEGRNSTDNKSKQTPPNSTQDILSTLPSSLIIPSTTPDTATNSKQEDQAAPKKKKKPRDQTPYSANITASVMAAKKNLEIEGAPSFIGTLFNHATSAIKEMMFGPIPTNMLTPKKSVDDEINEFQSEIEKLESKMNYDKNDTAADDELLVKKIKLMHAQIVEHAARRVDLFFYLILAVRGTYAIITKDDTVKQHGKGSEKRGTQGCHSSLFPNLKFTQPIEEQTSTGLINTVFNLFFTSSPKKAPRTLSGTYLEEALNMTYELPGIVNSFDGHLEGRFEMTEFADDCLAILNKVSKNEIDPIEAMNQFIKVMNDFFNHIRRNYLKIRKQHRMDYPKTFPLVWEYEREGTFIAANLDSLTVKNEYIALMLGLKKIDTFKAIFSLEPYYQRIQDEIYASKSPLLGVNLTETKLKLKTTKKMKK